MKHHHATLQRRAALLAVVVVLQAIAALFFVLDLFGDVIADGMGQHLAIEGAAVVALVVAVFGGALQIRALVLATRADEAAVAMARGAAAELVRLRFAQWKLTRAEADVALFALKGCDIAEIARLRGAAAGTVRAQLARVYAKAGVGSHAALLGSFLEDLIVAETPAPAGLE
ncbi:helix-turn-helix transcriptional regulator [Novosphingobium olei]|uniref:Helix-turn-helix transcriptional regulator n=1 Tax=Novosphingobium olei TaxID=2728851 RepID=A0A7Y0G9T0_9SPHN|nr:helix-turn-helix transcriptional regulator [Novosphingobium olei]NML93353.1 helix-turn-helix transcriptional regulator [Novosphingobium olei]